MAIPTGLKVLYSSVLIFTGGMLTGVLVVIWKMPDLPGTMVNDELCMPQSSRTQDIICDKVEIRMADYIDKELQHLHNSYKDQEKRRRAQEEEDLSVELKSFLETLYPYRRPSARFTGKDAGETTDDSPDMTPIRNWQSGRRNTDYGGYERYGVRFNDGRVVVPLTGLYFVYSLIDMYEPCNSTTGMPTIRLLNDTIKHSIFRYNVQTGVDDEIASNSIPHQKSKRFRYNYYSSYLSTVHTLMAGDELTLKTSNSTYLNFSPEKNYFGVNMI